MEWVLLLCSIYNSVLVIVLFLVHPGYHAKALSSCCIGFSCPRNLFHHYGLSLSEVILLWCVSCETPSQIFWDTRSLTDLLPFHISDASLVLTHIPNAFILDPSKYPQPGPLFHLMTSVIFHCHDCPVMLHLCFVTSPVPLSLVA